MKNKITSNDIVGLKNYIQKLEKYIIENGSEFDLPNILEQRRVQDTITYLMWHGLPKASTETPSHESKWLIGTEEVFGEVMSTYTCDYCGKKVYESSAHCPSCGHLMLNYKSIIDDIKEFGEPLMGTDDLVHAVTSFDEKVDECGNHRELTPNEITALFGDKDEDFEGEVYTDGVKSFAKEMFNHLSSNKVDDANLNIEDIDDTELDEDEDWFNGNEDEDWLDDSELDEDTEDDYDLGLYEDEEYIEDEDEFLDKEYVEDEDEFLDEVVNTTKKEIKEISEEMLSSEEINRLLSDGLDDELSRVGQSYGLNLRRVEDGVCQNKQKHWNKVNISSFAAELPKGYTILGSNDDEDGMGYVVTIITENIENYNKVMTKYINDIMNSNFGLSIVKSGKEINTGDAFRKLMSETTEQLTSDKIDRCVDILEAEHVEFNPDIKVIEELSTVLTDEDKQALLDGDLRRDQLEAILKGKYDLDVINKLCKIKSFMRAVQSYEKMENPSNNGVHFLCQFLDGFQANREASKDVAIEGLEFDEGAADELSIIKNRED